MKPRNSLERLPQGNSSLLTKLTGRTFKQDGAIYQELPASNQLPDVSGQPLQSLPGRDQRLFSFGEIEPY